MDFLIYFEIFCLLFWSLHLLWIILGLFETGLRLGHETRSIPSWLSSLVLESYSVLNGYSPFILFAELLLRMVYYRRSLAIFVAD